MNGYDAYQLYQSIKLHFTVKNYSYFKYNGKTNLTPDTYNKLGKKRAFFEKLGEKYDKNQLVMYYVSQVVENQNGSITFYEYDNESYTKWKGRVTALKYNFRVDNNELHTKHVSKFNDMFDIVVNDMPLICNKIRTKQITPEFLPILFKLNPAFLHRIETYQPKFDLVWTPWKQFIIKYSAFIELNDKKEFVNILRDCWQPTINRCASN